jgi:hypothetical protein
MALSLTHHLLLMCVSRKESFPVICCPLNVHPIAKTVARAILRIIVVLHCMKAERERARRRLDARSKGRFRTAIKIMLETIDFPSDSLFPS